MKPVIFLFALLSISFLSKAQDFEIPDYQLKDSADYSRYEEDVLNCIQWLKANAPDKYTQKRDKAKAFLLTWIMGSPNVTITLDSKITTFSKSPELFLLFMAGWTQYSLETRNYDDAVNGALKGIMVVIDYYEQYKDKLGKNKGVEKYIKMKSEGTLENYVRENISVDE